MSDMPERVWADPPETFDGTNVWHSEPSGRGVPYIRLDLHEAALAAIKGNADDAYAKWAVEKERADRAVAERDAAVAAALKDAAARCLAMIPDAGATALDRMLDEARAEGESIGATVWLLAVDEVHQALINHPCFDEARHRACLALKARAGRILDGIEWNGLPHA